MSSISKRHLSFGRINARNTLKKSMLLLNKLTISRILYKSMKVKSKNSEKLSISLSKKVWINSVNTVSERITLKDLCSLTNRIILIQK